VKKTQRRVQLAVLAAAAVTAAVLMPGNAVAKPNKPVTVKTTIQVVADGLDTPRGLVYDRHNRRVLVAEAGQVAGNDGPCGAGNGGVIYCYGETGAVFAYREDGGSGRIATGLPSLKVQDNSAILGVHDLDVYNGRITGVFGLSGSKATFRDALVAQGAAKAVVLAQSAKIAPGHGNVTPVGDLGLWEDTNNPDGRRIDSDPYGVYTSWFGSIVADAAGNDVLLVTPNGQVHLLVYLPPRTVGGDPDYESVPTSVTQGPDGALYISELTGFPYHKGTARILRWVPGQQNATVYREGFTNIVDFAFDERGRLVVLEIAKNGLTDPVDSTTGRLVRVEHNGQHTELASTGLENPGGVAVAGHGTFYVTNRTTSTGDTGQLLKLRVSG
jgi:hypothetical protein